VTRIKISASILWVALVLLAISSLACASETSDNRFLVAGINDPTELRRFLEELQQAVKAHRIRTVADMVTIPITVYKNHDAVLRIGSKAALVRDYDRVFDSDVTKVLLCQNFEKLGANYEGVMVGRGALWIGLEFQGKPKDSSKNLDDRRRWKMKVIGINQGTIAHENAASCVP
jgi:hypothetical protein